VAAVTSRAAEGLQAREISSGCSSSALNFSGSRPIFSPSHALWWLKMVFMVAEFLLWLNFYGG